MRPTVTLAVEKLEEREVPATWGTPWPTSNITLSFAPDGTDINGIPSNLAAMLSALGGGSTTTQLSPSGSSGSSNLTANELVILRAFQTWVANANINIGVVSDSGNAFGAPGQIQGDPRFGDIRIGGRALAGDVGALTAAFNYLSTQSGDIMLNTGTPFSIGGAPGTLDLQTVMLHEAGHSLGLGDNQDTSSVEYTYYQGVRTSLGAGDIAAIQGLYGARQADAYEGAYGNNTMGTATTYSGSLTADLSSTSDVDYYRFSVSTWGAAPVITLQASGLSLVQAQVDVVNSFGQVVAHGAAADPLHNDFTVTAPAMLMPGAYYVRVSSATGDVFGVGSYHLSIGATTMATNTALVTQLSGLHNTFGTAAVLTQTVNSVNQQLDYTVQVAPNGVDNTTYLQVQAPASTSTDPMNLVVSIQDVGALADGQVAVFDANQNQLSARTLTDCTGATVVQVDNVTAGATYVIRVTTPATYNFTADFTTKNTPYTLGSTGGPTAGTVQAATLTVLQSQVMQFVLTGTGASNQAVKMTIYDSTNTPIFVLMAAGGTTRSASVFLGVGAYRVEMSLVTADYLAAGFTYTMYGYSLTDPIGIQPVDTTGQPVSGGTTPGSTPPPSSSTVIWTAINPGDGSLWF